MAFNIVGLVFKQSRTQSQLRPPSNFYLDLNNDLNSQMAIPVRTRC